MFEDSLIESQKKIKTRRGWTTILSFVLQALAVTILVLIPLVFTQALPITSSTVTQLVAPPPPPPPPPPAAKAAPQPEQPKPVTSTDELRAPVKIPQKIAMIKEAPVNAAAPPTGVVGGVPGGVPGGQMGGVIGGVIGSTTAAVPKVATPNKVRVSQGVTQGLLLKQVKPSYPPLARQARIQGQVVLEATIGKDGTIQNLHVVSGHPMLTKAALDAVKQWKYKPYVLNGQPVEVETNITVDFNLAS